MSAMSASHRLRLLVLLALAALAPLLRGQKSPSSKSAEVAIRNFEDDDLLAVRAEDLNVLNMMVANSVGDTIHDERFFEGKPNAVSSGNEILEWNQEMRSWSYGHLLLLNLRYLVRPLYSGFPDAIHWEDYPANSSGSAGTRAGRGRTLRPSCA